MMLRPGLDHPPPGIGEGLRERDMPAAGVPDMKTFEVSVKEHRRLSTCVTPVVQGARDCQGRWHGAQVRLHKTPRDVPGTGERGGRDGDERDLGLLRERRLPERCSLRVWPAEERLRWCDGTGLSLRELDEPASSRFGGATVAVWVL